MLCSTSCILLIGLSS